MIKLMPRFLRLNDARRDKKAFLASLTETHRGIIDILAAGGSVYGGPPAALKHHAKPSRMVISVGKNDDRVIEDTDGSLTALTRAGWLRFAQSPVAESGHFWLTDSTIRLWKVLGRKVVD